MRHSPLRHPLAVLRIFLGLTQKELAALVDRSPFTLRDIELGRNPLGDELAVSITSQTGISLAWLKGSDPDAPMVTNDGRPYTKEEFEGFQALKDKPLSENWEEEMRSHGGLWALEVLAAAVVMSKRGYQESLLFKWKMGQAMREVYAQFNIKLTEKRFRGDLADAVEDGFGDEFNDFCDSIATFKKLRKNRKTHGKK